MSDEKKEVKLTEEELITQAQELEQEKQQKYVDEYNALCAKYGYMVQPKITLEVTKKNN